MTGNFMRGSPQFATTRWSLVTRARGAPEKTQRAALNELLALYWFPLYAFARRRGARVHDAQDLVQGFLSVLVEHDYVADAVPELGRFRTFLLVSFKNYWSKQRDRAAAKKRVGALTHIPMDVVDAERRLSICGSPAADPEAMFDRMWANSILDQVVVHLRNEAAERSPKHAERLTWLLPALSKDADMPYREIAAALSLSETAVKVAVHRLRKRYREVLRAIIADTVQDPSDIDEEIRRLIQAVRGS